MATVPVLVSTFHPFSTLSFAVPDSTPLSSLPRLLSRYCPVEQQSLSQQSGRSLPSHPSATVADLVRGDGFPVCIRLAVRLPGGKGGFGSQLRAAGGRMSSGRHSDNGSCRDLNGRRLNTIKEAQHLAAYLESAPEREKAKKQQAKDKLSQLQEEIKRLEAQEGTSANTEGKKRRFEDTQFLEQSREIVDNVKGAMAAGEFGYGLEAGRMLIFFFPSP
jgi:Silencing defective 2 N-terminal ubiquitin domain